MNRMKFKEGDKVEVCRGDGVNLLSWFRARIVSVDKHCYKVQCDNILNANRKPLVEDVNAESVRPEPPVMTETRKLATGDVIEVYDNHSWKLAKVVSTLPGRLFTVELMEPLRQKKCHQSIIRPRLFWLDGKWISTHQVDRDQSLHMGLQLPKESHIGFQCRDLDVKNNASDQNHRQSNAKLSSLKRLKNSMKRKPGSEKQSANEDDLMKTETASFKRRAMQSFREVIESSLPIFEKADSFSFPIKQVGEECPCLFPFKDGINQSVKEAEASRSSTAISCSYLSNSKLNSDIKHSDRPVGSSPLYDAWFSCEFPTRRKTEPLTKEDIAAEVHKLELRAYRKTIRAFLASGCLTWKQEALLTDLRFSLHISEDEHMYEVKYLWPVRPL